METHVIDKNKEIERWYLETVSPRQKNKISVGIGRINLVDGYPLIRSLKEMRSSVGAAIEDAFAESQIYAHEKDFDAIWENNLLVIRNGSLNYAYYGADYFGLSADFEETYRIKMYKQRYYEDLFSDSSLQ